MNLIHKVFPSVVSSLTLKTIVGIKTVKSYLPRLFSSSLLVFFRDYAQLIVCEKACDCQHGGYGSCVE